MFVDCLIFCFCSRRSKVVRCFLDCREISACAMRASPLDVRTVTMSRLVCAPFSGCACGVRCSVFESESCFSTMVSKSSTCTFVLRCMIRCQGGQAFLIWVLLIEHLVGRQTLSRQQCGQVLPSHPRSAWLAGSFDASSCSRTLTTSIHTWPSFRTRRLEASVLCTTRPLVKVVQGWEKVGEGPLIILELIFFVRRPVRHSHHLPKYSSSAHLTHSLSKHIFKKWISEQCHGTYPHVPECDDIWGLSRSGDDLTF